MLLRDLPSVDRLLQALRSALGAELPHALLLTAARAELDAARAALRGGEAYPSSLEDLTAAAVQRVVQALTPSLRPVINATGVLLQTNLGRAPLSSQALAAMAQVGGGYANLEYDLVQGQRGSRYTHLEALLTQLTGAEAALAVNNNAAAIYLVLLALASGHEVVISRGQAVEIGGGFRIPDVLRQSGATLVEVGTTNRTYVDDYAAALSERTALLLRVHSSNFRIMGFVHEASLAELAQLAQQHGIPLLDDLGSGTLLPTTPFGLAAEPTVQESIAAGADLVTFSGDKLLGGPQAGLIVGRKALIAHLRRHPLMRALRLDKTTIAGLEATLLSYRRGRALEEIPIWQMLAAPVDALAARARAMAAQLTHAGLVATALPCESTIGGGSLPGATLASYGVALTPNGVGATTMAARLRMCTPAVVARISAAQVLCDLRTVPVAQEAELVAQLVACYTR
ncbi:L-seryl-tRNA(Sec) selenium transferase [Candidatus Viridilinea mediisalina]|uniref:L-seryl-tRNA(Sec) selenium transferase n=1 Tax=Candidatus Viridilinea mediisalina TaxID=2024553 RepID=A0A2A6RDN0_9CHLR|nr:L-seryl-tRNA(Sec) selenium transferase [Candidatus Viridilinea mediisalina]PDW00622.1 L-seryl-tRNA(Sec) selenium transferase [Candidatus Viridilinea mediisalina]